MQCCADRLTSRFPVQCVTSCTRMSLRIYVTYSLKTFQYFDRKHTSILISSLVLPSRTVNVSYLHILDKISQTIPDEMTSEKTVCLRRTNGAEGCVCVCVSVSVCASLHLCVGYRYDVNI